jgi:hypothetical protein
MTTILEAALTPAATEFPGGWHIDPRTGWPWPGIIQRREDDQAIAEALHRAATHIRTLRKRIALELTNARYEGSPVVAALRRERTYAARDEIRALRDIFARPAPRSAARLDLAGSPGGGAESRDGASPSSRAPMAEGVLAAGGGASPDVAAGAPADT